MRPGIPIVSKHLVDLSAGEGIGDRPRTFVDMDLKRIKKYIRSDRGMKKLTNFPKIVDPKLDVREKTLNTSPITVCDIPLPFAYEQTQNQMN